MVLPKETDRGMTLKELQVGKTATILSVGGNGALRQHFLDMGLIQGTEVTIVKYAPMGDPVEIRIHGYELTIRLKDAGQIEITPAHEPHYKKKEGRQPLGDAQHSGGMEKQAFFMRRKQSIRYQRIRHLRLHWLEIRIVEKQRCSTS